MLPGCFWAESDWPKTFGHSERLLFGKTLSSPDLDYRYCCRLYRGIVLPIVQLLLVLSLLFSYSQLIRLWGPPKFVDIVSFATTVRSESIEKILLLVWLPNQQSITWKVVIETRLIDYYWATPIWVNWGSVTFSLPDRHIDGIFRNLILGGVGKSGFRLSLHHANEWETHDRQIRAEFWSTFDWDEHKPLRQVNWLVWLFF